MKLLANIIYWTGWALCVAVGALFLAFIALVFTELTIGEMLEMARDLLCVLGAAMVVVAMIALWVWANFRRRKS